MVFESLERSSHFAYDLVLLHRLEEVRLQPAIMEELDDLQKNIITNVHKI